MRADLYDIPQSRKRLLEVFLLHQRAGRAEEDPIPISPIPTTSQPEAMPSSHRFKPSDIPTQPQYLRVGAEVGNEFVEFLPGLGE